MPFFVTSVISPSCGASSVEELLSFVQEFHALPRSYAISFGLKSVLRWRSLVLVSSVSFRRLVRRALCCSP